MGVERPFEREKAIARRSVLFLQGPPGPLFRLLGERMRERGVKVTRINLSGGDWTDWSKGTVNYRGSLEGWESFVDGFLQTHEITDLFLFGDCRAYHEIAHRAASARAIRVWVLEEGYIRPHWMTLELHGVNGNSLLPDDPQWYLDEAKLLPPAPKPEVITASFGRRARDSYLYYQNTVLGAPWFPFYRTHRPNSVMLEGIHWFFRLIGKGARKRRAKWISKHLEPRSYVLFPLQLSSDYQIRRHSPFDTMEAGFRHVVRSFAQHAPRDLDLLVKVHPLDCRGARWTSIMWREARINGIEGRIKLIDGGNLGELIAHSRGVVTVNSTSGTLALAQGVAVKVLGDAVYNVRDVTDHQDLDTFWLNPQAPDYPSWRAFHRVLLECCLVSGGIASKSAVDTLINSIMERFDAGILPGLIAAHTSTREEGSAGTIR